MISPLFPVINRQNGDVKQRHLHLKEKYPDKPQAKGPALTGVSIARPETKNLEKLYSEY